MNLFSFFDRGVKIFRQSRRSVDRASLPSSTQTSVCSVLPKVLSSYVSEVGDWELHLRIAENITQEEDTMANCDSIKEYRWLCDLLHDYIADQSQNCEILDVQQSAAAPEFGNFWLKLSRETENCWKFKLYQMQSTFCFGRLQLYEGLSRSIKGHFSVPAPL